MGLLSKHSPTLVLLLMTAALLTLSIKPCSSFNPKRIFNASKSAAAGEWQTGVVTWYGSPTGDGSDGGACGYTTDVSKPPYNSMVAAISDQIWQSGKACGGCFQVKCLPTANKLCSGTPVTVIITDECPGGCGSQGTHFDLSGTAFLALASSPENGKGLQNAGTFEIQYQEVDCKLTGAMLTVKVDSGSNPNYLAVLIEDQNGNGEIKSVKLKYAGSPDYVEMQQSWGAVYKYNSGATMTAPFSFIIVDMAGRSLEVKDVIPANWKPGSSYNSNVNF